MGFSALVQWRVLPALSSSYGDQNETYGSFTNIGTDGRRRSVALYGSKNSGDCAPADNATARVAASVMIFFIE